MKLENTTTDSLVGSRHHTPSADALAAQFTIEFDHCAERVRYCECGRWIEMDFTWLGQYKIYPSSMDKCWQGRRGGDELTNDERETVVARVLIESRARRGLRMQVAS